MEWIDDDKDDNLYLLQCKYSVSQSVNANNTMLFTKNGHEQKRTQNKKFTQRKQGTGKRIVKQEKKKDK